MRTIRFATVCSGIGAPEVALGRLGWQCVFQAEIEPFPCAEWMEDLRVRQFPEPNLNKETMKA